MVQAKNITKHYGQLQVLKGVDLTVEKGEIVSIVGASGAGKTTLLQILGTLDRMDQGSLSINGINPFDLNAKALAQFRNESLGFIFQFHQLLPEFSAVENVCFPALIQNQSMSKAKIRSKELLDYLSLSHRFDHKPGALSGGEQQRLSIGRALLGRPRVLLLDEPFSHVDGFHKERLLQLLTAWQRKTRCTVVLVAHDVRDAARWAHRIDVLQDGSIVESGSGAQLFAAPRTKPMAYAWGPINELPWARVPEGLRAHPHAFRQGGRWFLRPEFLDAELLAQTCGSMSELERWTEGGTTYVRASAGGLHWLLRETDAR